MLELLIVMVASKACQQRPEFEEMHMETNSTIDNALLIALIAEAETIEAGEMKNTIQNGPAKPPSPPLVDGRNMSPIPQLNTQPVTPNRPPSQPLWKGKKRPKRSEPPTCIRRKRTMNTNAEKITIRLYAYYDATECTRCGGTTGYALRD